MVFSSCCKGLLLLIIYIINELRVENVVSLCFDRFHCETAKHNLRKHIYIAMWWIIKLRMCQYEYHIFIYVGLYWILEGAREGQ